MNETPASPSAPSTGSGRSPATGSPAPASVPLRLPTVAPRVTFAILGLTSFVYLLQLASQFALGFDLPVDLGAKSNELIRSGEIWRLITPILLHASILHIGFNMYALFSFGAGLERRFGYSRFLLLYLLAGFSGNVLSFLFSNGLSVGASTAIFGLIGAEGVFLYQNRRLFAQQGRAALGNVVSVALFNLFLGFSSGGLIDNWGHIGGLFGGLIFAWFAGPRLEVEGIYPSIRLVDTSDPARVWLGAALVLILFGGLATVGILSPLLP